MSNTVLKPPTNNPDLPSFLEAEYLDIADELTLVLDCWNDLKDRKALYLPQEESEPGRAYHCRLDRTRFDNRFEPAIRGHAGLLSDFEITDDAPPSLLEAAENIDLQGNDIVAFWQQLDEVCLRDGGVGILVEYPKEEGLIESKAELLQSGRRPYLIPVDRRNVLNWVTETINGVVTLQRVTVREFRKVGKGLFGSEIKPCYRVLSPGYFQIFEIIQKADNGGWQAVLIEEGETALDQVPLIWYSTTGSTDWFVGKPPFLNLAGLNIEHLQKRSSLNEVLHKCNMPVPVRKGVIKSIQDLLKPIAKLIIGPNSVVDVPTDGDFYFAEPTGAAIGATQTDIKKLEDSMDRVSLAFLGGGEGDKTATEVVVDSAQTQCTLKAISRRKENAFWKVAALWCAYTGEDAPEDGAGLKVKDSVLQAPPNPQDVQTVLDAMGIKISNRLGLEMLLERKWLPAGTDIDEELKLLEPGLRQPEDDRR